jgi:hypothetical protein
MKNKIIGIFVCMLMIATAVPAVTSIKNSVINTTVLSPPQSSTTGIWSETQKLLASDGAAGDEFGIYTSLDGDTAIIGANWDDDNGNNSGSAYVFTCIGNTWTQQAKLLASDGDAEDWFGCSVALSGDTAIIGAEGVDDNGNNSGSAYVFIRTGTTWTQQQKLLASDGTPHDNFGIYVSLDGDTALIGARADSIHGNYSGSAYVFTRTGTTWTQQQKLVPQDGQAEDNFGICVSLKGDTALIGAWYDDDNGANSGSAYVFTRSGMTWTQQAKLLASDGAAGDEFGNSVFLSGDTAIIASPFDDDNAANSGSAYVFVRTGTTWTQQQKLLPSDGASGDQFSMWNVGLDGDTALIGAWYDDDNGANSGSAYVFTRTGTTWTQQQKILASDGAAGDNFAGYSISGNTAIITSWYDDDNGANSGSAYVFTKVGLTFSITGGLGVSLKITNNGIANVSSVPWWIHVEGGILGLINKTVNGTINISAGATVTVGKIMLFGLGPITITAKVADEEKTATGWQIIIISMVKK